MRTHHLQSIWGPKHDWQTKIMLCVCCQEQFTYTHAKTTRGVSDDASPISSIIHPSSTRFTEDCWLCVLRRKVNFNSPVQGFLVLLTTATASLLLAASSNYKTSSISSSPWPCSCFYLYIEWSQTNKSSYLLFSNLYRSSTKWGNMVDLFDF